MRHSLTSRESLPGATGDTKSSRWDVAFASLRGTPLRWLFVSFVAVIALTGAMLPFRAQLGVLNVLLLYLLLTFFLALNGDSGQRC